MTAAKTPDGGPSYLRSLLGLFRPLQWLKNGFVFTPLVFSRHLLESAYVMYAAAAFLSFCLMSSAVYVMNDILDREADRSHPQKRNRPVASGRISPAAAGIAASLLFAAAAVAALSVSLAFAGIIAGYFVLQTAYSIRLKHVALVDIFLIAFGFMLRVIGGAVAIDVVISHWIVITTLFLSLFLAASKRRSELELVQRLGLPETRPVLQQYSIAFLDSILVITATGVAISYSLYTMAERTITTFGSEHLIFTTVFVLFGIFRYLFLVLRRGEGENPTAILVRDVPMGVNLLLWLAAVVAIIYLR